MTKEMEESLLARVTSDRRGWLRMARRRRVKWLLLITLEMAVVLGASAYFLHRAVHDLASILVFAIVGPIATALIWFGALDPIRAVKVLPRLLLGALAVLLLGFLAFLVSLFVA
jgi:hypothetical protein